jgi:hypothetical protein
VKRSFLTLILLTFALLSSRAPADEGMWLYNAFPTQKVKAKYGFAPTQQWLDHVRLSSVRFNNGGSGSFVSADGLTFTNHHVGADCIQKLSTGGEDHMKTGFYAKAQAGEAKCPDLELNQLVGMEDVTAKVNAAVKPGMSTAETGQAQRAAMTNIEQECTQSTGLRCDVVTLYSGEIYNLYKYKKYTDVRLVFAPEFDAAFFGGDPDNFTYPRYDLDITFFRVYENGKPAHLDNYLKWARAGVKNGDLVFVSGHPGSTGRQRTVAQLEFLRDMDYPSRLGSYQRHIARLKWFGAQSPENARIAQEELFGNQNSFKAVTGYLDTLKDQSAMSKRTAEDESLHTAYKAKHPGGPDPWEEISKAQQVYRQNYQNLSYIERMRGFNSELAQYARTLVRVTEERQKPNEKRLREYRDSALPSLEQKLFSTAPIYKSLEIATLSDSLAEMQQVLGEDNPDVREVLNSGTPDQVAKFLIERTRLDEPAYRKQIYEGGVDAINKSPDPLLTIIRAMDPIARKYRKIYDDEVDAVERREGALIAKARFAAHGFDQPPDAGFTLRLSYGAVKGYQENGRAAPYFTTIGGALEHSAEHKNEFPFNLPESWFKAKSRVDLKTPLNFVSTADIIGGNSGSPTVNKAGEVVGIVFDGNIQSLAWNFVYTDKVARGVHVDARGIQEALRNIYGANALADELLNGTAETDKK